MNFRFVALFIAIYHKKKSEASKLDFRSFVVIVIIFNSHILNYAIL